MTTEAGTIAACAAAARAHCRIQGNANRSCHASGIPRTPHTHGRSKVLLRAELGRATAPPAKRNPPVQESRPGHLLRVHVAAPRPAPDDHRVTR